MHIPPPAASPQKPGAQLQPLEAVIPSADAVFAPQLVQTLELSPLANEPEGHAAHPALPVASLYVPAPHPVHGPPSPPMYPKEQMHAVTAALPVTDTFEPDGHVEQSAEPMPLLYVPATHAVQFPPLVASPVNPAGHPQLMLPSADTALLGQLVHTAEPLTLLYVPAVHAAQLPPLAAASPVKPAAHAQLLIDVFPSADTTLTVVPTEQPQNITAGRCSPIAERQERGSARSKVSLHPSSQPPSRLQGGTPHPPSLHAERRSKSEDTRVQKERDAVMELGGQGPLASSPRFAVSPSPSCPKALKPQHLTVASSCSENPPRDH